MNLKDSKESLTDSDLIEKYCNLQDELAFNALYERYEQRIYSKCIAMLKDVNHADEALQEIFIKIFLNISGFKAESKFSTWVYSVTYNHCIDKLRKTQREQRRLTSVESLSEYADEVDDKQLLEIKHQILEKILNDLKAEDKALLLMKYKDDRRIKSISEVLDISESAVKMRLKRAKEKAYKIYLKKYKHQYE